MIRRYSKMSPRSGAARILESSSTLPSRLSSAEQRSFHEPEPLARQVDDYAVLVHKDGIPDQTICRELVFVEP
jgi:hypothetical protein